MTTARAAGQPFGLLALDLDDFKQVNDTLGHAAGDAVLRDVATVLADTFPDSPAIGRFGGDEFTVVIQARVGDDAAFHIRRLTTALQPVIGDSIGHAVFPFDGPDLESLLLTADRRSYETKRGKPESGGTARHDLPAAASRRSPVPPRKARPLPQPGGPGR